MDTDSPTNTATELTTEVVEPGRVQVEIPGIGTVIVLRAMDTATGKDQVRIRWDGDPDDIPTIELA